MQRFKAKERGRIFGKRFIRQGSGIEIAVSREIESSLNRDEEDFELTVSSAGIGYPFKVEQQYQKNLGKSVEIKLNDHTKLNGILLRFTPEEIVIEQEEKKIIEGIEEILIK